MPTYLSQLFDLPRQVRQGDFVLKLTDGVQHPEATLRDYVVTPRLAESFDAALGMVRDAITGKASKGAYLHGSFGTGKSHFMAVLNLLLRHEATAWSRPELAAVLGKHDWARGKRFLLVPYHMIGARDMASALLGGYVDQVARLHPEAPHPGVYRSEGILESANRIRARMGDAKFFEELGGTGASGDGWGTMSGGWAADFDAVVKAPPADERRARLVSDLVRVFFPHARDTGEFVDLDLGLSIISRHARDLGYDAIILFLDELILWLAGFAADPTFVTRQGQLVSKLVEAQNADRPIPLVSFIARQRDLRELVGENMLGNQYVTFSSSMQWWEERFSVIKLDDRDLTTIAQKRVLKVRSEAARQQLEQAFRDTGRIRREVVDVLLTSHGNPEEFHRIYPFSPALMETLVALSALLQRERTALKIMFQLLVEQQDRLVLGDIVPVGDLFDILLSDSQPLSQALKEHFEHARKLYLTKFLPLIEQEHGLRKDEVLALPVEDSRGAAFRRDDRIAKTLLLSALAPEVESFKAMTVNRLAALNHGTIKTPIPGREGQMVFNTLRKWAASIGQIRLGEEPANQTVSVQLAAVDLDGILRGAAVEDNAGNQIRKVKELVYEMMGFPQGNDFWITHAFTWRASRRQCQINFLNAREATDETLANDGAEWKLIIDFPFDPEPGRGPRDDERRLQEFKSRTLHGARTVVWLPSFLSHAAKRELGHLVLHDHILSGNRLDTYASHLSAVDRNQARTLLDNQRSALRMRVKSYLDAAYGIGSDRHALDTTHSLAPDEQIVSLDPTFQPDIPAAANLRSAAEQILDRALASQFPGHPLFDIETRTSGASVRRVWGELERAAQSPEGRVAVESSVRKELRQVVEPLKLATTGETHMVLGNHWKNHFQQREAQHGGAITVGRLRQWINEPQPMGLAEELMDLIILTYARQTDRLFVLHGAPIASEPGKLRPEIEVREQRLPTEADWAIAIERSQAVFGLATGQVRNAGNATRLAQELKNAADRYLPHVLKLASELIVRIPWAGGALTSARRSSITAEAQRLLTSIQQAKAADVIDTLARLPLANPLLEIGVALKSAEKDATVLASTGWEILEGIRQLRDERQAAAEGIWQQLRAAFEKGPLELNLAAEIGRLGKDATRLLIPPAPRPVDPPPVPTSGTLPARTGLPPTASTTDPVPVPAPVPVVTPATSQKRVPWSPDDSLELEARCANNPGSLDVVRVMMEQLKSLYGRSQAKEDVGFSGIEPGHLRNVLEVHFITPLHQGGGTGWANMVVVTPTLHALLHADPSATVNLREGWIRVAGTQLHLDVEPDHLGG